MVTRPSPITNFTGTTKVTEITETTMFAKTTNIMKI